MNQQFSFFDKGIMRVARNIVFLIGLLYVHATSSYQKQPESIIFPIIKNISYQDLEIQNLRSEITHNMKLTSSDKEIYLKWRRYKIKKGDQFFHIMAKTMQDPDTISSINRLSSVWDVEKGDIWWIPNMRGIATHGNQKELSQKYKVNVNHVVRVPIKQTSKKKFYFILGVHFKPQERSYFNLAVFERPVNGDISSPYGLRKDPFSNKIRFHKGIDIACKMSSQVWAAAMGRVILTGYLPNYGKSVIIQHKNGYQSLYGHLSKIVTRKGSLVSKKKLIAYSGSSGKSTGPHLHFEIRRKGKARKPKISH